MMPLPTQESDSQWLCVNSQSEVGVIHYKCSVMKGQVN